MKKYIITLFLVVLPWLSQAQSLKGYYYNEEYQVYLQLSIDSIDVKVPEQDIYGEIAGYFGSKRDARLWLITDSERTGRHTAHITVVNDYGSEDFDAEIKEDDQGQLTVKHLHGSTFKIVVNKKYVKLPKTLILKKKQ